MATKEELIAQLMDQLSNPALTAQEFNELKRRIDELQTLGG